MLSRCHCLSAPRWPGRASGSIPLLHLPSRTHGEYQWWQRHHGELWPRPSGPGTIECAGPGGLRPEAAPLLRRGAETSADDQEGPQDAGSQWTEGTTSDTALYTGASLDPPSHFCLESVDTPHLTELFGFQRETTKIDGKISHDCQWAGSSLLFTVVEKGFWTPL